jgi:hypothetical protein
MGWTIHKAAVVIPLLIMLRRSKFSSGSEIKQRNSSHHTDRPYPLIPTEVFFLYFATVGEFVCFTISRRFERNATYSPKNIPAWKFHGRFGMRKYASYESTSQEWKLNWVFNLDEVGMSEWEDCKEKKVIIPLTMDGQTIHHGVSRSVRHISVIAYIAAGGEPLTPFVVASHISDGIRKRLTGRGVRLGVDLVLRQWSKPYVSREFFLEYIKTIFLPYLNEPRESEGFEACEAMLLMNDSSSHVLDEVVAVITNARVRFITFAPHTTHIFKMRDAVREGIKKVRSPPYFAQ